MLKTIILFLTGAATASALSAQSLYMPKPIQEAYEKGTRSIDGRPGKNYWQNTARYNIHLTALPPDRIVRGTESITYINDSPDTLRNPLIKLFLNIHKPGAARWRSVSNDYLTTGVQIDAVGVNGSPYQWKESPYFVTVHPMPLPKPLAPHDSVKLDFTWHYQISLESGREGMIDSTTYFLAYFYPRVAVFDDYNGWDRIEFNDALEFYSDFNDYNVTITAPKNYIVWGTGTLQQPEKLLQPAIYKRFIQSQTSDQTIRIATQQDLLSKAVTTQNATNDWTFKASQIPDMAFGVSDHYVWDGGSIVVDKNTGRRASVQSAYNDTAADFKYMVEFGKHSLGWFSNNWPGVAYPYEKSTIFQGYADMEYPMMVNDEAFADTNFARFVAEHEIAHTYMPFYMGINETRYGFMDEGWATTFELLIGRSDVGTEQAEQLYKQFRIADWASNRSPDQDLPIITPGDSQASAGLGNNEYGKPSLGYLAVKDLLGDMLFKKCLQEYMSRWHGKHPIPWDFFNTINNVSGQDLNWFWNNWYFSHYYIDMAIDKVEKKGDGYSVTVNNIGGYASPVDVIATFEDGSTQTFHQTPKIWQADQKKAVINFAATKKLKTLVLDGGIFMDAHPADNVWENK